MKIRFQEDAVRVRLNAFDLESLAKHALSSESLKLECPWGANATLRFLFYLKHEGSLELLVQDGLSFSISANSTDFWDWANGPEIEWEQQVQGTMVYIEKDLPRRKKQEGNYES